MFVYCHGTLLKTGPELLRYATGDEMRACQVIASELALQGKYLGDNALGKAKYIDLPQAGMEAEAEIPKEHPGQEAVKTEEEAGSVDMVEPGVEEAGGPDRDPIVPVSDRSSRKTRFAVREDEEPSADRRSEPDHPLRGPNKVDRFVPPECQPPRPPIAGVDADRVDVPVGELPREVAGGIPRSGSSTPKSSSVSPPPVTRKRQVPPGSSTRETADGVSKWLCYAKESESTALWGQGANRCHTGRRGGSKIFAEMFREKVFDASVHLCFLYFSLP